MFKYACITINKLNSVNRHITAQSMFLKVYIWKLKPDLFGPLHRESRRMPYSKWHHILGICLISSFRSETD